MLHSFYRLSFLHNSWKTGCMTRQQLEWSAVTLKQANLFLIKYFNRFAKVSDLACYDQLINFERAIFNKN